MTLELECIDRMYLNLYVPRLQTEQGVAWFFRHHRGHDFASSALMALMTRRFVESVEDCPQREAIELVTFKRKEGKEEVAKRYLAQFSRDEGGLFVGKAQERATASRTVRRKNPATSQSHAWLVKSNAMVNQYYRDYNVSTQAGRHRWGFYCVDVTLGRSSSSLARTSRTTANSASTAHSSVRRVLSP